MKIYVLTVTNMVAL